MSNVEERVGSMTKLEFPKDYTFEQKVEEIKNLVDFEPKWCDLDEDYVDINWLSKDRKREIVWLNGDFWHVNYTVNEYDVGNIEVITKDRDYPKRVNFVLSYYNGGTCFEDIMNNYLAKE